MSTLAVAAKKMLNSYIEGLIACDSVVVLTGEEFDAVSSNYGGVVVRLKAEDIPVFMTVAFYEEAKPREKIHLYEIENGSYDDSLSLEQSMSDFLSDQKYAMSVVTLGYEVFAERLRANAA